LISGTWRVCIYNAKYHFDKFYCRKYISVFYF